MFGKDTKHSFLRYILFIIFFLYVAWWIYLNFVTNQDINSDLYDYFTDSYGVVALVGGMLGFLASKKWEGWKSVVGRSVMLFSIGLLFQFLGQLSYAIYHYAYNVENPYPSFGEIFYFGSIPINIYAMWLLSKAMGFKYSMKSLSNKLYMIVVPIAMIVGTYSLFLSDYKFDPTSVVGSLLDFSYPIGHAVVTAFAITALVSSRNMLGGKLRKYVLFVLGALFVQYFSDSLFLYQTLKDTWTAGGISDFAYMFTYMITALSLIKFGDAAEKIA